MKIKTLKATFGRLRNARLELEPGLNIIEAPNESGKSTWCAFLTAMLYGVDTSERDKAGFLAVKTKYKPWSGEDMAGTMEFTQNGDRITVQRSSRGTSPMKRFAAMKAGSGSLMRELTAENIGETLTGVSRDVFERTAFITRAQMRVSKNAELEKRISSLVSSGDEQTSFSDAERELSKWQRGLKSGKTGRIPALEAELDKKRGELELLESSSEKIAALRGNLARCQKQIELLENDLVSIDKLERRDTARRLVEAKQNADEAEKGVRELTDALTRNGHLFTRSDIQNIRDKSAAVVPMKTVAKDAESAFRRCEKELRDTETKKNASPLAGRTENEVKADIERAAALEKSVLTGKPPQIPRWAATLLTVAAAVLTLITSGLLVPFSSWVTVIAPYVKLRVPALILSMILLAVGIAMFFVKLPYRSRDAEELTSILSRYSAASSGKIAAMLQSYKAICRETEIKSALCDSARESYENARSAADAANDIAVRAISDFMPEIRSGEDALEALSNAEKLIDRLTQAEFDMISYRNVYETLQSEFTGDLETDLDNAYIPSPLRGKDETKAALKRLNSQLAETRSAYDLALGAERTLGDPLVLSGEIDGIEEELAESREKLHALELALETLRESSEEIETRFSPRLGAKAGAYLERLTDGRYTSLMFDKSFAAQALEKDSAVPRDALYLSEGTADEIYFSLRLAMCELMLTGSDPCPIILDDALANFDDRRCKKALELLREIAKTRQVILFTCRHREREMAEKL